MINIYIYNKHGKCNIKTEFANKISHLVLSNSLNIDVPCK